MIRDGLDVFYYTQPVDSDDQAISLTEYLSWHGVDAFKDDDDQNVLVPLSPDDKDDAANKTATVYMLVSGWRLFWEHRDSGVFGLPVYVKD